MIVGKHMTENPVVIGPDDFLSTVQEKMKTGGFRRVPVVHNDRLIGIVTDRDLRQYMGLLEKIKVNAVMTVILATVSPRDTIEKAAQLILKRKIGGLPVVEEHKLVGVITTSDLLQTFLDVMGASEEGTSRIDFLTGGEEPTLAEASKVLQEEGAEILSLGTHREKWDGDSIFYLRLRSADPNRLAEILKRRGFTVLGVHA
ncbi:MAG TPA: CBS and ACT domain-containing protein [Candidatus Binatia bacterium]